MEAETTAAAHGFVESFAGESFIDSNKPEKGSGDTHLPSFDRTVNVSRAPPSPPMET